MIDFCLEGVAEALGCEDLESSRRFCEQSRHLMAAMRMIQDSWPWTNLEAYEESYRQYERGELMPLETFKNELLRTSQ
jgi:hypothetical protein